MQLFGFNPTKCKTQCRLGVGRIKLLRNKKQLAMKALRKEVAELMRQGKQGNARIRVEAVMREHRMLQAFEILELYLELLAVRAELLAKTKELPPDMVEAISSLIYAGERVSTDLAEVAAVGKLLVAKYTPVYKEAGFPHEVASDLTCRKWQVNDDLVTCLAVSPPMPEEKLAFLDDIASEHDVAFDKDAAALDMLPAARKPLAVPAYPVETLAAGGAEPATGPRPALAQGWQPPAVAPPPPPSAHPQPGWHPPTGAAAQGSQPGGLSKLYSGAFVVRGGATAPGFTELPSASEQRPDGASSGWKPPTPEDMNQKGRSFVRHVDAAANWRHSRVHGTPAGSSSAGSGPAEDEFVTFPQRAELPGEQQQQQQAGAQAPLPGSAHSSGYSTPSVEKPVDPSSSYTDASQAAEAAKRYSHMAAQAAQRAEEFVTRQASTAQPSRLAPGPAGAAGPSSGAGSPDVGSPRGSGSCGGDSGGGQQFVPRTLSEIKRAYDAAPGPPSKPSATAGPPSAPPAPADEDAAAVSSVSEAPPEAPAPLQDDAQQGGGGGGDSDVDVSGLPSVPSSGQAPPPPVADELDELTRRFEALKRR